MIRKKLFCYSMRTKEALISPGVDPGFLERACICINVCMGVVLLISSKIIFNIP